MRSQHFIFFVLYGQIFHELVVRKAMRYNDFMDDADEKRKIIDIIDEAMIRFVKNRDEALENVDIKKLFPDKKSFIKTREMFAERMGVDKNVVRKIFDLLYSKDSESSLR